ncbi:peptidase C65 Otubain [Colletotrichum orchidophilum]|uniref:ubiquitinyl hydrolase 1 n=1 Tax=Colletotrichum orchidophilum TaxID=1209926 RepID=A0A1G4AVB6_9PEZI|nr:peptidase C65 Otubain [Colletotrichum orchidophilum]OHE93002.1 peptidase C65 Otubain [Colletotrichum orchidophilum]
MFQPQPTPFAFHASVQHPYSHPHPHAHGHSYIQPHGGPPQDHPSQNSVGYGISAGTAGLGDMMMRNDEGGRGGGVGRVEMRIRMGMLGDGVGGASHDVDIGAGMAGSHNGYLLSPGEGRGGGGPGSDSDPRSQGQGPSQAHGQFGAVGTVGAGVGAGVGSSSGVSSVGLDGMGNPLVMGGGSGGGSGRLGLGMGMGMGMSMGMVRIQVAGLAHQQQTASCASPSSTSPSPASPPPLAPPPPPPPPPRLPPTAAVSGVPTAASSFSFSSSSSSAAAAAAAAATTTPAAPGAASPTSTSSSSRSFSRSSHPHSRSPYSHHFYSNHNHHTPHGHGHVQQQHPHRHPGASSSTTSSSAFYTNNSHANASFANTAAPDHANAVNTRPSAMEPGDPSDVAAQEAAARDYQPQLEGSLVGDKITSDAITDEYAKADDIYIAKTINLPQTYSHYRPVQGDGNCGWRAIGFSYFEHLINNGDQHQILGEVARITSLNQYLLNVGGYDRMLFEDMVDETIGLLKDVAQHVTNPPLAMDILAQRFNDQGCSNAIIYHLRLLALSWLKGNVELYEPFIPAETGIIGYCAEIERPNREIDHLGIILLVQVLLKPLNFVLEIAYLDRSPGNQVNIYRFPDEANGQDPATLGPIIYLLYRPDHYDILYKSPPNPAPLTLQVNRVGSFSHPQEITSVAPSLHSYANLDFGPLAMLPGFGGPPSGLSSGLSSLGSPTSTSPLPDAYDPSPQSPWLATPYSDHIQQQQQQQQQHQNVAASRPQSQAPARPQQSTPAPTKPSQPVDYQLRFSHQCWHLNNTNSAQPSVIPGQAGFQEPSFTTAMFKNSHFNKAHYNNPHFHPEEWTPDEDGHHERLPAPRKKGRIRSDH